jgi:hypothetical protein
MPPFLANIEKKLKFYYGSRGFKKKDVFKAYGNYAIIPYLSFF